MRRPSLVCCILLGLYGGALPIHSPPDINCIEIAFAELCTRFVLLFFSASCTLTWSTMNMSQYIASYTIWTLLPSCLILSVIDVPLCILFSLTRLQCRMQMGLNNQSILDCRLIRLPDSLVIQIPPKISNLVKVWIICEKITHFKCVSNQSDDIFAYANENSQFDRTDNNQSATKVVPHRNSNIFTELSKRNMIT